jgi:hypothetical protein
MPLDSPHRRGFVRSLVLGGTAATLAPRTAAADEKPDQDKDKVTSSPPRTEADARMDLILARFGGQLDEAARASVREGIEAQVRRAETLRKFPLDNGDGPFPVFIPYRGPIV